jgi:hypothetical protein
VGEHIFPFNATGAVASIESFRLEIASWRDKFVEEIVIVESQRVSNPTFPGVEALRDDNR